MGEGPSNARGVSNDSIKVKDLGLSKDDLTNFKEGTGLKDNDDVTPKSLGRVLSEEDIAEAERLGLSGRKLLEAYSSYKPPVEARIASSTEK